MESYKAIVFIHDVDYRSKKLVIARTLKYHNIRGDKGAYALLYFVNDNIATPSYINLYLDGSYVKRVYFKTHYKYLLSLVGASF